MRNLLCTFLLACTEVSISKVPNEQADTSVVIVDTEDTEAADTEAGTIPMVYLVSSAESGVSATAAKPNISRPLLSCYPLPPI